MRIKVGVIFGGESVEHEVSIISAIQAIGSMDTDKYDIIPIYIGKDRTWYTGRMLADIDIYRDMDLLKRYAKKVTLCKKNGGFYLVNTEGLFRKDVAELDIAFPIVHGINVEDEKEKEKIYNPDEEAYINARRKIQTIKRAKRNEKNIK